MTRYLFGRYSGPFVALGGLVAVACLASTGYINRLQADLARAVSEDAAGREAAVDLMVHLRHLRVHSLVLVADPTDARRDVVRGDLARVDEARAAVRRSAAGPDDAALAARIDADYLRYRDALALDRLPPPTGSMADLARWSDDHHMEQLLVPCREYAERKRDRMNAGLVTSRAQTTWAGRVLVALGAAGVLGGLLSGYATARRAQRQERELLRAEHLAAVGRLAAGVAHEVRNPLTGIKFLIEAALRPTAPTALTPEDLGLISAEIVRIERTVQELLDHARGPAPVRRPHDLRDVIAAAVDIARSRADRKAVALRTDVPLVPIGVSVDRDQMLSLLTNLLYNAVDAAPPGSEVAVSADPHRGGAVVAVTDAGAGIDPAVADSLFTPFATTKPTGTGLGLAVARRVALAHGGTLTAAARPGGGACFTLTLPAEADQHAEALGR